MQLSVENIQNMLLWVVLLLGFFFFKIACPWFFSDAYRSFLNLLEGEDHCPNVRTGMHSL